ncbi:MAG TPA: hypothetical protein VLG44_01115 [Chlamydiales bacterium]|nr:hypothetical protein [Chlamydiales bacterium]
MTAVASTVLKPFCFDTDKRIGCSMWMGLSRISVALKTLSPTQAWIKLLAYTDRDWGKIKGNVESKPEKLEFYRNSFGKCFEIAVGNLHALISKLQDHPSATLKELTCLISEPVHILRHCKRCCSPTIVVDATQESLVCFVEEVPKKCDEKAIFRKVVQEMERAFIFQAILNGLPQKV